MNKTQAQVRKLTDKLTSKVGWLAVALILLLNIVTSLLALNIWGIIVLAIVVGVVWGIIETKLINQYMRKVYDTE